MFMILFVYYYFRCGESEIRTREPVLPVTRFPGVPLQPLEHLSFFMGTLSPDASYFTLFADKFIYFFLYSHIFWLKSFGLCVFFVVLKVLLQIQVLKYAFYIVVCDSFCLAFAYIIYMCHFSQHFNHKSTLISLPPMRDRSEVRSICFEYDPLQRDNS